MNRVKVGVRPLIAGNNAPDFGWYEARIAARPGWMSFVVDLSVSQRPTFHVCGLECQRFRYPATRE